jgi:Fe-S-cluster containining protein
VSAFCLDIHAGYRCRHAGACCESWTVPAEAAVIELVRARDVRRTGVSGPLFLSSLDAAGAESWTVARDSGGDCVFFDRSIGGLCLVHRDLGVEALPSACRHFPRRVLHDARGTMISLSHFCPTAAATLLSAAPLSIVEAHPPLRLDSNMEGLDASDALPPLLRPGLLCDIAGYDAWERAGIATFACTDRGYETCLGEIASATDAIYDWKPGREPLTARIARAFGETRAGSPSAASDHDDALARVRSLTQGRVEEDLTPLADFDREWDRVAWPHSDWFERGMKNYLAARLFGNWIAYQGRGLRSIVEWLRTSAEVVRHFLVRRRLEHERPIGQAEFIESVRSADLLLLHVLDSAAFARQAATIEEANHG